MFWVLWACLAKQSQSDTINLRKPSCLFAGKKSTSSPMLYWRYCKDMQTSYFGYFGHAWLHTSKMIISTCTRLWCLSVCKKQTSSFTSFLRYYILKNPAIWLADSIGNKNFARYEIGGEISTKLVSTLDCIQEKLMTKFFKKSKKNVFWGHFGPFLPEFGQKWIFLEKRAVRF